MDKNLRYYALGAGTGLIALGMVLDKLPQDAIVGGILIIMGIASADMIKHRND